MSKVNLLICEDLPGLRSHAIKTCREVLAENNLQGEFQEASNGLEAIKLAHSYNPSLILMDIAMPELNGIKAASAIWKEQPTMKILFWSQYQHEAYIRELGKIVPDEAIHGYILKSESDAQLKEAIVSVYLHHLPYIARQIQAIKGRLKDKSLAITDLEYETLVDIFSGLTDKAIAQKEHISYRGVQNRLSALISKVMKNEDSYLKETAGKEVFNPRARLIFEALRRGLLSLEDQGQIQKHMEDWLFSEFGYDKSES